MQQSVRRYSNGRGVQMTQPSNMGMYLFRLGLNAQMGGDLNKALELYEKVIEIDPEYSPAWMEKGNCLDGLCKYEEAIKSYDAVIERDPCNAEAWFDKGFTLKKMGRTEQACECMDKSMMLSLGR
ncbi:MAG: tetratricopeptide repeat protein [Methanomicrobiales archaeon]|nr:tetratricopeptide repeat protein [Methanomicrobiales archaeon]